MKAIYEVTATHNGKPAGWIGDARTKELAELHPSTKYHKGSHRIRRRLIDEWRFHALMASSPDGMWTAHDHRRAKAFMESHRWEGKAMKAGILPYE